MQGTYLSMVHACTSLRQGEALGSRMHIPMSCGFEAPNVVRGYQVENKSRQVENESRQVCTVKLEGQMDGVELRMNG